MEEPAAAAEDAMADTPRADGQPAGNAKIYNTAWLNACAQGVVARHQPEQSFVLVNLGQLTARFYSWATRFPRVQPFLSVGEWGLDSGMLCVLSALGCGFAFSSGAGLSHVIAAGVPSTRLMFEREFQTSPQLRAARDQHVEFVTVHSKSEMDQLVIQYPKAKVLLRVHPKHDAPHAHSALAAEIEQITQLTATATALGLTVVGVRLQTVVGVSASALKSTISALQEPFKASAATSYSFDVLDLGSALNELDEKDSADVVAALESSFDSSVRFHANASTFLEQRTHTLYLNVLAKEAASAGTAAAPAAANGADGASKRKADALSVSTANDFVYHVSTALAPPISNAQAKVCALKPRSGAALHSSSLVALPSAGAPPAPVGCLVAELGVGDWLAVQESAAWCPSSFLAPHTNMKGQKQEPQSFYVFGGQAAQ